MFLVKVRIFVEGVCMSFDDFVFCLGCSSCDECVLSNYILCFVSKAAGGSDM